VWHRGAVFHIYFFYLVIIVLANRLPIVTKVVTKGERYKSHLSSFRFLLMFEEQSKCKLPSVSETFLGAVHTFCLTGIPFVTFISNCVKNKREAFFIDASGDVFAMGL
jgi:hypothetical protein